MPKAGTPLTALVTFPFWRDFVALVRRCMALIPLRVCVWLVLSF